MNLSFVTTEAAWGRLTLEKSVSGGDWTQWTWCTRAGLSALLDHSAAQLLLRIKVNFKRRKSKMRAIQKGKCSRSCKLLM